MRRIALAALATALLAVPAPAGAARSTVAACETAGRSLAGSSLVRVFEDDGRVIACSLENGRRMSLGNHWDSSGSSGGADVRPLVVAERIVAWQENFVQNFEGYGSHRFAIANVRSGVRLVERRLRSPGVMEAVVRESGSAAWIEDDPRGPDALLRRDPNGVAILAWGEIAALALSERSTLYWTERDAPRSATLEPSGHRLPLEHRTRKRCGRFGYTWAANAWGRVIETEIGGMKACSKETGRIYNLGEMYMSPSGEERFGPVALAYRLLAYYRPPCAGSAPQCALVAVRLRNLRTGRERVLAPVPPSAEVSELVVKQNGSVAFVQDGRIRIVDRRGDRILGMGADLALSEKSVVYWTDSAGQPRFEPID